MWSGGVGFGSATIFAASLWWLECGSWGGVAGVVAGVLLDMGKRPLCERSVHASAAVLVLVECFGWAKDTL